MAQTKRLTKAFISYSRKDTDFARKLHTKLTDGHLSLWADWDSIPLTANWMAEITHAIEEADAFIFIITPDSLGSEYCMKELQIAVDNGKRMVPVLHRMPRTTQMKKLPPELSAHQWVYIRKEDNFGRAVQNMVQAINTDLDWLKGHTRLQERALEWNRKKRDASFLLRGADLEEAEAWLATASADRKPAATKLQNEYVLASRRQETDRQRNLFLITAAGLALAIVLAVAALFAWREAEAQARIALSRQLAAQSLNNLSSNPALSMLLSVQAFAVRDDLESRTSLLTALAENPSLSTFLHEHDSTVFTIEYDPRGRWLASGGGNDELYLWDLQNRVPYARLSSAGGGDILSLAASPSGQYLAVGDAAGAIQIWDMDSQISVGRFTAHEGAVQQLVFTPDGRTLISAGADGNVHLWTGASFAERVITFTHGASVLGLAVSSDGSHLASGSLNGELFVWDLATQEQILNLIGHSNEVNALAFTPDGTRLFSAGRDTVVRGWSIPEGGLLFRLEGHSSNVRALTISPNGNWLASGGEDQRVLLWTLLEERPRVLNRFTAHTNWVNDLAFSPDSQIVASASYDTNIILWRTTSGGTGHFQGHRAPIRRVLFGPTGADVFSGAQDGTFAIWQRASGGILLGPVQSTGSVFGMDLSANGQRLVTSDTAGVVQVWDTATGAVVHHFAETGAQFFTVALSPDGNSVAAGGINADNALVVWDLTTGESRRFLGHTQFIRWVAFHPDGRIVATAGWDGQVIFWDLATGLPVTTLVPHPNLDVNGVPIEDGTGQFVLFLAFSPDGSQFVTTSSDHTAKIWQYAQLDQVTDTDTSFSPINIELLYTLEAHSDWVHGAAFSPDGTRLVTVSEDKTIILWDLVLGIQIARLTGHEASVNTVAFSPDGKSLATGSSDNDLILWSIDFAAAPQALCQRVNRNFTETEWEQYLGGVLDYTETCAAYLPSGSPAPAAP